MKILLLGSGGREHALCQKIYESRLSKRIYCLPGNVGTSKIAQNINVDILNFKKALFLTKIIHIQVFPCKYLQLKSIFIRTYLKTC